MNDIIDRIYHQKREMEYKTGICPEEIYISQGMYRRLCDWSGHLVRRPKPTECSRIFDLTIKPESMNDNVMVLISMRFNSAVKWAFRLDNKTHGEPESIPIEPSPLHHQCLEMQQKKIEPWRHDFMGWSYYDNGLKERMLVFSEKPFHCPYCKADLDALWKIHKQQNFLEYICKE